MGRRLVSTKDMSREEWLEIRKHSIGGSDAGAICGYNDWCSALEVYAEKKGMIPDKETTESMRLGTDLEDYVAQRFSEATGKKVRRTNFMYQHDEHDFITANVDREIIGENAGLECKTMNVFSKYDVADGEIPLQYYCQCQHYIEVMGYDYMYIGILVYGKGFYWHIIHRNESFIQNMLDEEIRFWNENILTDTPPEPDGSDSSLDTLNKMYPQDNGSQVWLDNEADITRYQELNQTIKRLEKSRDEIKSRIYSELRDSSLGGSDKYLVTWKTQSRTTVDSAYLKEHYPQVYEESKKVTSSRVLRVKERKQNG